MIDRHVWLGLVALAASLAGGCSCAPDAASNGDAGRLADASTSDAASPPDAHVERDAGHHDDASADAGRDGGASVACSPTEPPEGDPRAGAWDPRFHLPGVGGTAPTDVHAIAVAASGEVYVGGHFSHGGPVEALNVARYTDEAGWSPLGEGLAETVIALALHPSGSPLYAATQDSSTGGALVHRWDGAWTELAAADGWIEALAVDSEGALYAGGNFDNIGGSAVPRLARYAAGAWTAVGGAPDEEVRDILIEDAGLCIAGRFTQLGTTPARNVACWDGGSWTGRSLPVEGYAVQAIGRDSTGALVAGGHFVLDASMPEAGGSIARWTGSAWELLGGGTLGDAGPGYVEGIARVGTDLYVAGYFRVAGSVPAESIARWDGSAWHDVGGAFRHVGFFLPENNVTQLVAGPGGRVYAGGIFTRVATSTASHVAYLDDAGWHRLSQPGQTPAGVNGFVDALASRGGCGVYVGGEFEYVGEIAASRVVRIDNAGPHALGTGLPATVRALAVDEDGLVYAGGDMTPPVAVWDGSEWAALGGALEGVVYALLAASDGSLWAGGEFTVSGAAANLAVWREGAWSAAGALDGPALAILELDDGAIVVGGDFTHAGAVDAVGIARWDGAAWSPLGSGLVGGVRSLALHAGELIAGGTLESLGDAPGRGVARWDGTSWHTVGAGLDRPWDWAPTYVNGLASVGGLLFATGDLALSAGESDVRLAYFDGTTWHPMGSGLTDIAEALLVADDGLWVGGTFTSADGAPGVGLARRTF